MMFENIGYDSLSQKQSKLRHKVFIKGSLKLLLVIISFMKIWSLDR